MTSTTCEDGLKSCDLEDGLDSCDLNCWVGRWVEGNTPWHKTVVNPFLEKYVELFEKGKEQLRIFVPLCGKSIDMIWLAGRGHFVVGVEGSSLALESFFKENSLEYTTENRNGIQVYRDRSGRISLYCCDLFEFNKTEECSFDAIWDRGSFGAINPESRATYEELLSSLKSADCKHLLEVFDYDANCYKGAPRSIPLSMVTEIFGERNKIELIESEDGMETARRLSEKLEWFSRNLFLLTRK